MSTNRNQKGTQHGSCQTKCGHSHLPTIGNANEAYKLKKIFAAFCLNLAFVIIEYFGAHWFNSVSILADLVHDTGDTVVLFLSLVLVYLVTKIRHSTFTFGLRRLSVLGGTITVTVLFVGSLITLYESIGKLQVDYSPQPYGILLISVVGIVINFIAYRLLSGHGSITEDVLSLHLLEDVLGWFATLLGSIGIIFFNMPKIDAWLGVGISIFILWGAIRQAKRLGIVLLEGKPHDINQGQLEDKIRSIPQVIDVHDIHIWSLDGEKHVLTCHVVLPAGLTLTDAVKIRTQIKQTIFDSGITHSTVEFDPEGYLCETANNCQVTY